MPSLLSKISPFSPSKNYENEDSDEYNVEYSFALEYNGPPLSYNIPKAIPVDVDQIPEASILSDESVMTNLPLPVIHPIVKSNPQNNRPDGLVDDQGTSSGSLEFSESQEISQELSETSEIDDSNEINDQGTVLESSNIQEIEELNEISDRNHARRPSTVTFHEPEDSSHEPEVILRRPDIKKGSCYNCLKKNRFSEKEVCLVCNAKYCENCVIRAMGSLPEGRKCITCIGYPIDESKRGLLGKPSRVLKQLLTDPEIKNIMQCEMFCERNRLPSRLVFVNGKALCREEFDELLNCLYPPKKIKPGRYWYDKTAGFWGKEGEKPCQIITAELPVGGEILQDCSKGKANVVINKREITKTERRLLQWRGIRCEGRPSFWLGADGSLQEEGMNNVIAKLWEKSGIHLVCSLLSLPIPPQFADLSKSNTENVGNGPKEPGEEIPYKLLLVGSDQSGTSTIFKQARMVHNIHFSNDEREKIKTMIRSSLYTYLGMILEHREQLEEEYNSLQTRETCSNQEKGVYSLSQKLTTFSDFLVEMMISGKLEDVFPSSREYSPIVADLLKDGAFQATYKRMDELHMVPRDAKYILERADEISRIDYEPSDTDILNVDGITSSNGLVDIEFSYPKPTLDSFMDHDEANDLRHRKYQLIRIHSSTLGENCKWIEMFEDTDLVLYTVSLTDYNQSFQDKNGVSKNKMLRSKLLLENIATHPLFHQKNILLVLTKFDLLEEKIEQNPLTLCEWFNDFNPVISHNRGSNNTSVYTNPSLAQQAFHYIGEKFKRHYKSLTGRKLYVCMVNGLEPKSVDEAFRYAREILKWEEEKPKVSAHDTSSFSNEASTST